MRPLIRLAEHILAVPFTQRVWITVLVFIPCLALYAWQLPLTGNGAIIAAPIVLSAWFFGYRGFLICLGFATLVKVGIYLLIFGSIWWPSSIVILFVQGTLSGALIGVVVGILRAMSGRITAAHLKAIEAEQAYHHQQQLNQAKDQLLLHISHELRTPLTAVQGYLELLKEAGASFDTASQALFCEQAIEGCHELNLMIETVLEAVRSEQSDVVPQGEQLALPAVFDDVLGQLDPQMVQNFSVQVDVGTEATAWADALLVRQVLRNLLSNAFKYAPMHTPILIAAVPASKSQDQVCISVQDKGPGIPLAKQSLIFQKFTRLERDMHGTIRGLGMGLYISKQLVEAMGGRIWVESSGCPGEGSRFCFTLPVSS